MALREKDHLQSDFICGNVNQGLSHVYAFKTVTRTYTCKMEIQNKQYKYGFLFAFVGEKKQDPTKKGCMEGFDGKWNVLNSLYLSFGHRYLLLLLFLKPFIYVHTNKETVHVYIQTFLYICLL